MRAKKVLSLRSLMTIRSTRASSSRTRLLSRSWVIGRGVAIFSIAIAIALASKIPTQIGRKTPSPASRRMTTGMLETGSIRSPLISILTIGGPPVRLTRRLAEKRVGQPFHDLHGSVGPGLQWLCRPDVDDAVASGAPLSLSMLVPPLDQDLEGSPDQPPVDLPL